MIESEIVAENLRFPEGPIAMADGSVMLVEVARGTLTRIDASGRSDVIAELGGGPNGAAVGPDGHIYVCNNGGFDWIEKEGMLLPGLTPPNYRGGSIQKVDISSGKVETLYTHCNGEPLKGPNDLVFDEHGGFWFTDSGKRYARTEDVGSVLYASCDGDHISECIYPCRRPNGIALSPDGSTLYFSETMVGRIWQYSIRSPGTVEIPEGKFNTRALLYGAPGYQLYDSMAIEANGNLCVGTPGSGAISVLSRLGEMIERVDFPDPVVTNIAFGGTDMRTGYVTLSSSGRLAKVRWARPGLPLNFR